MSLQADIPATIEMIPKENDDKMTKEEKRLFLVFSKVLLRYLQTKDPVTYLLAKQTIKEAIDHDSCIAAGQTCPISHMKKRLETLVPKEHWKKAEEFLLQKLKDKQAPKECNETKYVFDGILNSACAFNNICS